MIDKYSEDILEAASFIKKATRKLFWGGDNRYREADIMKERGITFQGKYGEDGLMVVRLRTHLMALHDELMKGSGPWELKRIEVNEPRKLEEKEDDR